MKKVTLTVGSMPEMKVARLRLDALVLIDYAHHYTVHALGMCPDPCLPAARTAGDLACPIFACAGGDVPTEHFAVHADGAAMSEKGVAEVLGAMDGLGARKVGFYIGLAPQDRFDVGPFVHEVAAWLNGNRHDLEEVFILSATPATTYAVPLDMKAACPRVAFAPMNWGVDLIDDCLWFFGRAPAGTAVITAATWVGDHEHPVTELQIPEAVNASGEQLRVREVKAEAFDYVQCPDGGFWRDEVRSVIIPRYVIRADASQIALRFPNVERVGTDPRNRHLVCRCREWMQGADDEDDDGNRLVTAEEFFGGVD